MSEKSGKYKTPSLIAAGFALGTAGVKLLSSKEAKKVYTHVTAGVLRAKDCVMSVYDKIRANCDDIVEDAKIINEVRDGEDIIFDIDDEESTAEADLSGAEA